MGRIFMQASYRLGSDPVQKCVEFIARKKESSEGCNLVGRAQNAAARREKVPASKIKITGCASD